MRSLSFPVICTIAWTTLSLARADEPLAQWSFDRAHPDQAHDAVSATDDAILGDHLVVPGLTLTQGALRMDGESTMIRRPAAKAPRMAEGLTVEAWIAVNAYPWNWLPLADQSRNKPDAGYSFGLDAGGHPGLQVCVQGKWQTLLAANPLPLRQWVHVAGTFDPARGLALYVDGKPAGELPVQGALTPAPDDDLLIGRVRQATVPTHAIHPKYPVWYSFDGLLDDLRLYGTALPAAEIQRQAAAVTPPAASPLPPPVLPGGDTASPGPFGAFYTTLHYDELWDASRRVGPDSDVVIRFDHSPGRLVFWQGTSYSGDWVTENNKWYTDEFVEAMTRQGGGDFEPMSDKQNRYSHVRILENSDARAVIHWRYAQCECEHYDGNDPDPLTGWTDWADEYFTVYPDGVAVRKDVAWTTSPRAWHEFQETIVINGAGTRPEDNIEPEALSIASMNGEIDTCTWRDHPPAGKSRLAHPNIQVVNLKSRWKPFQIVPPKNASITFYTGEKTFAMFEWWNHWPVTQVASSGISAVAPDRASHSSLSHLLWEPSAKTANSITKIMLAGLTTQSAGELLPLAKSWLAAPALTVEGADYTSQGYDQSERAFVLTRAAPKPPGTLRMQLAASPENPLVNPAFLIRNQGTVAPALTIDGQPVKRGPSFRYGLIPRSAGYDLVIWLELTSVKPVHLEIGSLSQP